MSSYGKFKDALNYMRGKKCLDTYLEDELTDMFEELLVKCERLETANDRLISDNTEYQLQLERYRV